MFQVSGHRRIRVTNIKYPAPASINQFYRFKKAIPI